MKKTLYVDGMHCEACSVLIRNKLKEIGGINEVSVDSAQSRVTIEGNAPHISEMNSVLNEYGYTLSTEQKQAPITMDIYAQALVLVVCFSAAYFLLDRIGMTSHLTVSKESPFGSYFFFGLLASVTSCAALVGGLLIALSSRWGSAKKPFLLFNIGRIGTFAILGLVLGFVGSMFQLSVVASAVLVITTALFMIVMGLRMLHVPFFRTISLPMPSRVSHLLNNPSSSWKGAIAVGALTFFIPCGFTAVAQASALSMANPIQSSIALTAFALGTLPMLAFISFASISMYRNPRRSAVFSLAGGFLIVGFGLMTLINQVKLLPSFNTETSAEVSGTYQDMVIEAKGFEYFPKEITLKVGIPVRLTVKNNNAIGCAQAMSLPGLYPKVLYLSEKETKAEFLPEKKGTYSISCSMGMVEPIKIVVL